VSAPARVQLEALGLTTACADVLRHLWDYLDDQITPEGAERLRAHISSCATCQGYEVYQECFLEAAARLRAKLDAPGSLRERLAAGLREQGCGCWEKVRGTGND
jgi:anti-sigma factor (TIGR02949 family)